MFDSDKVRLLRESLRRKSMKEIESAISGKENTIGVRILNSLIQIARDRDKTQQLINELTNAMKEIAPIGPIEPREITEEDVRRIVKEEMNKGNKETPELIGEINSPNIMGNTQLGIVRNRLNKMMTIYIRNMNLRQDINSMAITIDNKQARQLIEILELTEC